MLHVNMGSEDRVSSKERTLWTLRAPRPPPHSPWPALGAAAG